jgi:hypothetical protein
VLPQAVQMLAPLRRHGAGLEVHRLVDDREVAVVVEEPLGSAHRGVDADPELDVALEFGRAGDGLIGRPGGTRRQRQAGQQERP